MASAFRSLAQAHVNYHDVAASSWSQAAPKEFQKQFQSNLAQKLDF